MIKTMFSNGETVNHDTENGDEAETESSIRPTVTLPGSTIKVSPQLSYANGKLNVTVPISVAVDAAPPSPVHDTVPTAPQVSQTVQAKKKTATEPTSLPNATAPQSVDMSFDEFSKQFTPPNMVK
jgi:hypothetical protein